MLVERGIAEEANPLMAPLVGHSALAFALVKIGLTAGGVLLLTQLARLRAFGRIPVGVFLYLVLAIYGALIGYEISLLTSSKSRGAGGFSAAARFFAKLLACRRFFPAMLEPTPLYGGNADFLDALYEQYLRDPARVPAQWRTYFATPGRPGRPRSARTPRCARRSPTARRPVGAAAAGHRGRAMHARPPSRA